MICGSSVRLRSANREFFRLCAREYICSFADEVISRRTTVNDIQLIPCKCYVETRCRCRLREMVKATADAFDNLIFRSETNLSRERLGTFRSSFATRNKCKFTVTCKTLVHWSEIYVIVTALVRVCNIITPRLTSQP